MKTECVPVCSNTSVPFFVHVYMIFLTPSDIMFLYFDFCIIFDCWIFTGPPECDGLLFIVLLSSILCSNYLHTYQYFCWFYNLNQTFLYVYCSLLLQMLTILDFWMYFFYCSWQPLVSIYSIWYKYQLANLENLIWLCN